MNKNKYYIRKMTKDEVKTIGMKWAEREGWNPGLYDAECFYKTDPDGFWLGLFDKEPIACISAVEYNNNFVFLGFYIVKPEYRGKGFGLKIWNKIMSSMADKKIGLDGVWEQQTNYKKSGFKYAYSNIRYEGRANPKDRKFSGIVPLSKIPFTELFKYDSSHFPAPRKRFLKCWIHQPKSFSLAAVEKGKIAGYAVVRKCVKGYKIGPLFANNRVLADKLFFSIVNYLDGGSLFYLDIPDENLEAVNLAENYGMEKVFGTARMYADFQPKIKLNEIFGVTSFELG